MNSLAIRLDRVSKGYPLHSGKLYMLRYALSRNHKCREMIWALKDITFSLPKGMSLGVIGENGSGKTTLLSIIAGITAPSEGRVEVYGTVGALLELGLGFNMEATGRENVYIYGALLGASPKEIRERLKEIVEYSELGEFIDRPLKLYSTGMLARLAFSIAYSLAPDIFLIDETLAVGDARFQNKCLRKLGEMKRMGKTLVLASHDLNLLSGICDKLLWLRKGRIEAIGEPNEVIKLYEKYIQYFELYSESRRGPSRESDQTFGTYKATITDYHITVNGKASDTVRTGDVVSISVSVKSNLAIENPIVGFLIRNPFGIHVISINTYEERVSLPPLTQGQTLNCTFTFRWPPLRRGLYSVSLAVADGTQKDHEMCFWLDDAIFLLNDPKKECLGLMGLEDLELTWQIGHDKSSSCSRI